MQVGRIQRPLLAGVATKEALVEVAADLADHGLLGVLDVVDRLRAGGQERLHLGLIRDLQAVQRVDGGLVDRHGHEPAVDLADDPVLVGPPGGEPERNASTGLAFVWKMCGP